MLFKKPESHGQYKNRSIISPIEQWVFKLALRYTADMEAWLIILLIFTLLLNSTLLTRKWYWLWIDWIICELGCKPALPRFQHGYQETGGEEGERASLWTTCWYQHQSYITLEDILLCDFFYQNITLENVMISLEWIALKGHHSAQPGDTALVTLWHDSRISAYNIASATGRRTHSSKVQDEKTTCNLQQITDGTFFSRNNYHAIYICPGRARQLDKKLASHMMIYISIRTKKTIFFLFK